MNLNEKERLIAEIVSILQTKLAVDTVAETAEQEKPIEMLTIKECTRVICGLSEHTLRLLVTQGKIPSIRTGEGKRGKILVSKSALLNYFSNI
ncbi:MAG: helix-turn-helix domain-containing protein [Oscillospiraceae bacterium]|nr:helix-turn-helix domain-containing protein [Oscillospiraceae bacterium]